MTSKKATVTTERRRTARKRLRQDGAAGVVNDLEVLHALTQQLPVGANWEEKKLWHFVWAFDCGQNIPIPGLPPVGEALGSLPAFEQWVADVMGERLADNAVWRRLMLPEAVEARRAQRRKVDRAIAEYFDD